MKKLIFVVLTVFSLTSFSQTGSKNFIDQNYTEVTGKAETEIAPNEIYLNAGLTSFTQTIPPQFHLQKTFPSQSILFY